MNRHLLHDGLDRLGIPHTELELKLLERYLREIELWNPRYGLVKASGEELIIRHILDSLAPLPVLVELLAGPMSGDAGGGVRMSARVADVGSGAGFPGVPLAVFLSDHQVFLIENSLRRVSFLSNVVALLGLPSIRVLGRRVEDVAAETTGGLTGRFDLVTFRAFRPLDRSTITTLHALLSPGGWIAAYKGRIERIREELAPLTGAFAESRIIPLEVPFLDEERHLVLLR